MKKEIATEEMIRILKEATKDEDEYFPGSFGNINVIRNINVMDKEVQDLLTEIQSWMLENDYECGEWGSKIFQRISEVLDKK